MSQGGGLSERALVLAPAGRDAAIAAAILSEAGIVVLACETLDSLVARLKEGAALGVVVEEALNHSDLTRLSEWVDSQPPWSDFPFLILSRRGGSVERNPTAQRLSTILGNVSFLERPFHPTTLVSAAQTALRGRRRQYDARERIEQIGRAEAVLELRVAERTAQLEAANSHLAAQISERKKAESALAQAQRLEAIGQLTSGVAHDFNNLLTVVMGNVEQMKRRSTDPQVLRRLEMMGEASRRGAKLTAQMLAFSRRQKLEPQAVNLNNTVKSMTEMLESAIGGSIQIHPPRLAPDLWPAMIDPTQIELVILNLAINARDAMAAGGSLTIRTENVSVGDPQRPEEPAAGDYVVVSVADTGSGMTEDVRCRALEPFFTTKAIGKGSGLGLSQAFGLAKQSGGGLSIDTEQDRGTTIRVFLPRAEFLSAPVLDKDGKAEKAKEAGLMVLVVDDDDPVREITAGFLLDLGYAVVEAHSGDVALEQFERLAKIDAAVLDFAMPGMNGSDLARELRTRRPSLPIIFTTGYVDMEGLKDFSEEQIVTKPFTQSEIALKLSQALTRG